jgi:hypothetical protein
MLFPVGGFGDLKGSSFVDPAVFSLLVCFVTAANAGVSVAPDPVNLNAAGWALMDTTRQLHVRNVDAVVAAGVVVQPWTAVTPQGERGVPPPGRAPLSHSEAAAAAAERLALDRVRAEVIAGFSNEEFAAELLRSRTAMEVATLTARARLWRARCPYDSRAQVACALADAANASLTDASALSKAALRLRLSVALGDAQRARGARDAAVPPLAAAAPRVPPPAAVGRTPAGALSGGRIPSVQPAAPPAVLRALAQPAAPPAVPRAVGVGAGGSAPAGARSVTGAVGSGAPSAQPGAPLPLSASARAANSVAAQRTVKFAPPALPRAVGAPARGSARGAAVSDDEEESLIERFYKERAERSASDALAHSAAAPPAPSAAEQRTVVFGMPGPPRSRLIAMMRNVAARPLPCAALPAVPAPVGRREPPAFLQLLSRPGLTLQQQQQQFADRRLERERAERARSEAASAAPVRVPGKKAVRE